MIVYVVQDTCTLRVELYNDDRRYIRYNDSLYSTEYIS